MYVLTNDKNYLMYNTVKQFVATPDVSQAQGFTTAEKAENARSNLPKPLKNLGYHVAFVGLQIEPIDTDAADVEPVSLSDGIDVLLLLCALSHSTIEQKQWLDAKLTEVQQKICDVEHAIEFYAYNARDGYKAYKLLRELRRERRRYKDALLLHEIISTNFGNVDWKMLEDRLNTLKDKFYKPRFYTELFEDRA